MSDLAGEKSKDDVVQDLVSSLVWGRISETTSERSLSKSYRWDIISADLSSDSPCKGDDLVVNYKKYVDEYLLPYPSNSENNIEDKLETNRKIKASRNDLFRKFTHQGEIGESFQPHVDKIWKKLTGVEMLTKDAAPVIPSFFHLVNYLCERGINFRIIFRTFGSDLRAVLKTFSNFCEGSHYLFPDVKVPFFKKLNPDICTGAFFRSSDSDALVLGSTELPSSFQQKLSYSGPLKRTAVGYQNIYDAIKDALKENVCLGFTDYYHWWFSNNEAGWAGKLLVVDPNDTEIYQIFFDDNVSLDEREKNIVDVRTTGGMRLKISNSENFAIVKVIPAYAVINDNYFINELLEVFSNKTKFEA